MAKFADAILILLTDPDGDWQEAQVRKAFEWVRKIGTPAEGPLTGWISTWKDLKRSAEVASENIARNGFVSPFVQRQIRRMAVNIAWGEQALKEIRKR